jgi:hypothetical protein
MKLTKLHMLLILLFVLLASSWGWTVREYMKGGIDDEEEGEAVWKGRRGGGKSPFLPGVPTPKPKRSRCIPSGDEDYYVLKSQVVPPVCPKCPDTRACPRQKKCPACPGCKRCPEDAFECKKVPNYNAAGGAFGGDGGAGDALAGVGDGTGGSGGSSNSSGGRSAPQPRLNSFSQF